MTKTSERNFLTKVYSLEFVLKRDRIYKQQIIDRKGQDFIYNTELEVHIKITFIHNDVVLWEYRCQIDEEVYDENKGRYVSQLKNYWTFVFDYLDESV